MQVYGHGLENLQGQSGNPKLDSICKPKFRRRVSSYKNLHGMSMLVATPRSCFHMDIEETLTISQVHHRLRAAGIKAP